MPTRITEVEPREGTTRRLRVEGRLTLKEAGLLEGVCEEMREQSEAGLCIDLSAITFLDSESAAVLCRLRE